MKANLPQHISRQDRISIRTGKSIGQLLAFSTIEGPYDYGCLFLTGGEWRFILTYPSSLSFSDLQTICCRLKQLNDETTQDRVEKAQASRRHSQTP